MSAETGGLTAAVDAPPGTVLAALLDVENYPGWQSIMKSCVVVERDAEGRASLVDFVVDAKVRTVRYTSRYAYDLPHGFSWVMERGDLRRNDGSYRLTPRVDGGTDVAVEIRFEVGFFVPGPVKALIRDQSLRNSVRELRRHLQV